MLLLGKYFGFAILCGWICLLFFLWTSRVLSYNYALKTGVDIAIQTEYWMNIICIFCGIFISLFVLILLLQKKFSYILRISSTVEKMEAGDLSKRIPLEGEDELTELALSINHLADAMSYNLKRFEEINRERFQTIAVLSHDLRTPLTVVMSYLQFIKDDSILIIVSCAYMQNGLLIRQIPLRTCQTAFLTVVFLMQKKQTLLKGWKGQTF